MFEVCVLRGESIGTVAVMGLYKHKSIQLNNLLTMVIYSLVTQRGREAKGGYDGSTNGNEYLTYTCVRLRNTSAICCVPKKFHFGYLHTQNQCLPAGNSCTERERTQTHYSEYTGRKCQREINGTDLLLAAARFIIQPYSGSRCSRSVWRHWM